jgi:ABC-2 type transport system ATP-binding protein
MQTHEALQKDHYRKTNLSLHDCSTNPKLVCKIKNISYSKIQEKLELVGLEDRKTVILSFSFRNETTSHRLCPIE